MHVFVFAAPSLYYGFQRWPYTMVFKDGHSHVND
jgi:hypothetical protein